MTQQHKQNSLRKRVPDKPISIIIDSGAFSAWKLKRPIELDLYCRYLETNNDWITHYVVLDVIIPNDPDMAARVSFDNLQTMRQRGLNPIPVFHVGENLDWLRRILDLGCNYIGLSASSIVRTRSIDTWYAMAFSELVTDNGSPVVQTHAFGEGRIFPLFNFPWTSTDASTWLNSQRHGSIYVPNKGRRLAHSRTLLHTKAHADVATLDAVDGKEFADLLANMRIKPDAFTDRESKRSFMARSYLGAAYFVHLEKRINDARPIQFKRNIGLVVNEPTSKAAVELSPFAFHLTINTNSTALPALHAAGNHNLLASYFYLQNPKTTAAIKRYCLNPAEAVTQQPYGIYNDILQDVLEF